MWRNAVQICRCGDPILQETLVPVPKSVYVLSSPENDCAEERGLRLFSDIFGSLEMSDDFLSSRNYLDICSFLGKDLKRKFLMNAATTTEEAVARLDLLAHDPDLWRNECIDGLSIAAEVFPYQPVIQSILVRPLYIPKT